MISFESSTPPKTNMEPENTFLGKGTNSTKPPIFGGLQPFGFEVTQLGSRLTD